MWLVVWSTLCCLTGQMKDSSDDSENAQSRKYEGAEEAKTPVRKEEANTGDVSVCVCVCVCVCVPKKVSTWCR